MAQTFKNNDTEGGRTVSIIDFAIGDTDSPELIETTIREIQLTESLLTPGLQTWITCDTGIYDPPSKNFSRFKGQNVSFTLSNQDENLQLPVQNVVYRLDDRKMYPTNLGRTQQFVLHACDNSLLTEAGVLVSKSWKCTAPSDVVSYVLTNCANVQTMTVDPAQPPRDYIAENIHPFQVVAQQANVALNNDIPDFLHYMTYEKYGTHYFRSLQTMTQQQPTETYQYTNSGLPDAGIGQPLAALNASFPCDFDLLADILNGAVGVNTLSTYNPLDKSFNSSGGATACGVGTNNYKVALSNKTTASQQNSCNLDVETHLLLRQARMALLERDKIALRLMVPWNPLLHVGNMINFQWENIYYPNTPVYGSGSYLIASLTHTVRLGGFSFTTLDCVTNTISQGIA